MAQKKATDWKDRLGTVYSTDPNFRYQHDQPAEGDTLPPRQQQLRVQLDKKQRGGKQVTLITGFVGRDEDLKTLGKWLKSKCGVGGAAKDGQIVVQGDHRARVVQLLRDEGYPARPAGG